MYPILKQSHTNLKLTLSGGKFQHFDLKRLLLCRRSTHTCIIFNISFAFEIKKSLRVKVGYLKTSCFTNCDLKSIFGYRYSTGKPACGKVCQFLYAPG